MSFLFKSKKNAPPSSLPSATRSIHTSDGTPPTGPSNGVMDKQLDTRQTQSPQPLPNNATGSMSSMGSGGASSGQQFQGRQRSESEAAVRRLTRCKMLFQTDLYRHDPVPLLSLPMLHYTLGRNGD